MSLDDSVMYTLPLSPTSEELTRVLKLSAEGAFTSRERSPELAYLNSFLTGQEITGDLANPLIIRARFKELDWELTFKRLAVISAGLSRYGILGKCQQNIMQRMVRAKALGGDYALLAAKLAPHMGHRPILHERLMYIMFQLAAEECVNGGRDPAYEELAFLGLIINDHIASGYEDPIEQPEAFASSIALTLRYNHDRDKLRTLSRTYGIFLEPPPLHSELGKFPELWSEIQSGACSGRSLEDYVGLFLHPLSLFAQTSWGDTVPPVIDPAAWYPNAPELVPTIEAWLAPMTTTVQSLRAAKESGVIPRAPLTLLRQPFLKFGQQYWAATPWAVARQLHTGLRFRLLQSARKLGKRHEQAWSYGFGFMVEAWAHRLAKCASEGAHFRGRFEVADTPGTGEVEDVVWTNDAVAILFSIKSTLIAEIDGFNVDADVGIVTGLEKLLFAEPRKGFRGGAARLLHDNVQRVRLNMVTAARTPSLCDRARSRRSRVHVRHRRDLEEASGELARERPDRRGVQQGATVVAEHIALVVIASRARGFVRRSAGGAGCTVGSLERAASP